MSGLVQPQQLHLATTTSQQPQQPQALSTASVSSVAPLVASHSSMPAQPSRPSSMATAAPQKKMVPISAQSLVTQPTQQHQQTQNMILSAQNTNSSTASLLGTTTTMANSALNQQIAANVAGVFGGAGIPNSITGDVSHAVGQHSDFMQSLNALGTTTGR